MTSPDAIKTAMAIQHINLSPNATGTMAWRLTSGETYVLTADALTEMAQALLDLHEASQWQDISTVPDDETLKLFASPAGMFIAPSVGKTASREEQRKIYESTGEWPGIKFTATHWRPLPPAPQPKEA